MAERTIKEIIIHCTANRPRCKMTMQDFRRLHKSKGWSDVGYHYIVFEDGHVEPGRSINLPGSHCKRGGHNRYSIGIAYVGGLNQFGITADTRTDAQKSALIGLLKQLNAKYHVPIYGHRDFDRGKACPCFDAKTEYSWIR